MNYTSEIFDRVNIQHIMEFLLHGVPRCEISDKSYEGRIDELQKAAIKHVESGMRCGVALDVQFLFNDKVECWCGLLIVDKKCSLEH